MLENELPRGCKRSCHGKGPIKSFWATRVNVIPWIVRKPSGDNLKLPVLQPILGHVEIESGPAVSLRYVPPAPTVLVLGFLNYKRQTRPARRRNKVARLTTLGVKL